MRICLRRGPGSSLSHLLPPGKSDIPFVCPAPFLLERVDPWQGCFYSLFCSCRYLLYWVSGPTHIPLLDRCHSVRSAVRLDRKLLTTAKE